MSGDRPYDQNAGDAASMPAPGATPDGPAQEDLAYDVFGAPVADDSFDGDVLYETEGLAEEGNYSDAAQLARVSYGDGEHEQIYYRQTGEEHPGYDYGSYDLSPHGSGPYDDGAYEDGAYDLDGFGYGAEDELPEGRGAAHEWAGEDSPGDGAAPGETGPSQSWARARRPHRRRLLTIFGAVLVIVLVLGIVGFVRVSDDINPGGHLGPTVTVTVPKGASTSKIAHLMAGAGVVHGATVFALYLKLESNGPLLPGTYRLRTNEPYTMAMKALESGPPILLDRLTVPEGFTVSQMATAVGRLKAGITPAQFMAAARDGQVSSPYLPVGARNLEGFLFPAVYPVKPGESADDLVTYMVEVFDQHAGTLDLAKAAARLHYTPYQVVTVASIVEREAKFEKDRALIASVIYNRLAHNMPIGAQSTLDYAVGIKKGETHYRLDNRYNTLIHTGLPPTPISSPGAASLVAAMHPAKTDYLYWVEIKPDGQMGYASTEAGFRHLQQECRAAKLC